MGAAEVTRLKANLAAAVKRQKTILANAEAKATASNNQLSRCDKNLKQARVILAKHTKNTNKCTKNLSDLVGCKTRCEADAHLRFVVNKHTFTSGKQARDYYV